MPSTTDPIGPESRDLQNLKAAFISAWGDRPSKHPQDIEGDVILGQGEGFTITQSAGTPEDLRAQVLTDMGARLGWELDSDICRCMSVQCDEHLACRVAYLFGVPPVDAEPELEKHRCKIRRVIEHSVRDPYERGELLALCDQSYFFQSLAVFDLSILRWYCGDDVQAKACTQVPLAEIDHTRDTTGSWWTTEDGILHFSTTTGGDKYGRAFFTKGSNSEKIMLALLQKHKEGLSLFDIVSARGDDITSLQTNHSDWRNSLKSSVSRLQEILKNGGIPHGVLEGLPGLTK